MAISRTVDATCSDRSERCCLLKPNLAAHYPTVTRGEGPNLFDSLGTRYFDGPSGAMTANLGHGLPGIGEVMAEQALRPACRGQSAATLDLWFFPPALRRSTTPSSRRRLSTQQSIKLPNSQPSSATAFEFENLAMK
jgi:hypothetical protein